MFHSSLWRLYWFLVVSSVTLLFTVAYYTWYDIKEETLSESTYALKLISRSAHDQLRQQAAMLKILGRRLIDIGVFENKRYQPWRAKRRLVDPGRRRARAGIRCRVAA
ncbi:MAG: hypothetical protein KZQ78_13795, partial [Candidatus Thiodiazotropha sp. (ex Ustalcina ferruginea)]|nr:hypothetical protein [Candidatus Thiodiazotropha sp. (ex Ustalcina ferruginea)]